MNKVAIYTIACNEGQNVEKWVKTCKGADYIIVGIDVKSKDNTEFLLRKNGVKTIPINITPWRFDTARNIVLDKIPAEYNIVVSLDLDERFVTPNWRSVIESEWEDGMTMLNYVYNYTWVDEAQTIPLISSPGYKIHARNAYTWQHAVHENLKNLNGEDKKKFTNKIIVNHYPNISKPRDYNSILDRAVEENPNDSWTIHVRARERFNHGRHEECLVDCLAYLDMTKPYTTVEIGQIRAEMCRLIARSKYILNKYEHGELVLWMMRGATEAPNQRESHVYLGEAWFMYGNFYSAMAAFFNALSITDRLSSPECESRCWNNGYISNMINDCMQKINEQQKNLTK